MYKVFSVFLLTVLVSGSIFAESNQSIIDSLQVKLNNSRNEDRVDLLIALSEMYLTEDIDQSVHLAAVAADLSKELEYNEGGVKSYSYLGDYYLKKPLIDSAIFFYKQSLAHSKQLNNDVITAKLLNVIGYAYVDKEDFTNAIDYMVKSLLLAQETNNSEMIAISYLNIGKVMTNSKEFDQGLEYYNKSLVELNEGGESVKGEVFLNMGELYTLMGNYSAAETTFQKALVAIKQAENVKNEIELYINMADLYYAQKNVNNAISFYQSALKLNKKENDVQLAADINIKLGNCYATYLLQFDKGVALIENGKTLSVNNNYQLGVRNSYMCLSEAYFANEKYKEAYQYKEKYIELKDSVSQSVLQNKIRKGDDLLEQEKWKLYQRDEEVKRLEEHIDVAKNNTYVIGFVALAIILVLLVLISQLKRKIG